MEEKPDKKKESIDEILSDLNGLLNKMPSILDGIKMPEMQPRETPKSEPQETPEEPPKAENQPPAEQPEPVAEQSEPAIEQPEPVIEQPEPVAEQPEPVISFDAEKTVVLDAFSGLPEGSPAPESEQLLPQSLGDFMFGDNAESGQDTAPETPAKLSGSALEPPEEKQPEPVSEPKPLSISEFNPPPDKSDTPAAAALPQYDNTRDFGIPDIDSLMQMSDSGPEKLEEPAAQMPEAGVIPESVQAAEAESGLSIQGLDAAPPPQSSSEGDIVDESEPKEERTETPQPAETPAEQEPALEGQAQQAESPFDIFAIEPSSVEAAPATEGGEKQPEPAAEMPQEPLAAEGLNEPAAEPAQAGESLQFEAAAETAAQEPQFGTFPGPDSSQPEAQPGQAGASAGGIELSPGIEPGGQPLAESAGQTIPGGSGLELGSDQPQGGAAGQETPGGAGLELSVGQPQPEGADQTIPGGSGMVLGGGDETLVVPPPGGSSGEEEKTVIFQAQPSTTSRAQAGDLDELAAKQAPEGIPAERLRTLMFLYSAEDKALCATALAELDAICLKSAVKPMFIKRAAVKECEPDANANFIMQSMTDAGAQGLVCLGDVPQDKIYEIENVFNTSGGFFRYYDSSTFSHSAALDLVTDLILR